MVPFISFKLRFNESATCSIVCILENEYFIALKRNKFSWPKFFNVAWFILNLNYKSRDLSKQHI